MEDALQKYLLINGELKESQFMKMTEPTIALATDLFKLAVAEHLKPLIEGSDTYNPQKIIENHFP